MNYLMEGAAQQIKDEIQDIYAVIRVMDEAAILPENTVRKLLTERLERLGKELQEYDQ